MPAVLLACPRYAEGVPGALARLAPADATALRFYYTAAVLLGQEYAAKIQTLTGGTRLADLFSADLGLPPDGQPQDLLVLIGRVHRRATGRTANWAGAYENVARKLTTMNMCAAVLLVVNTAAA